jgi:molybdenum cofactor biosynthesis enzyme MoaA
MCVFKPITTVMDNKKITCALAQRGIGIENAGHVKLCNLSTHIFKDERGTPYRVDQTNLKDIWKNNVTRREINESLAKGQRHENCQLCWDAEDSGVKSIRQVMNEKYTEVFDTLPEQPSIVNMKPGNVCNFGCRFCSAEDSNQLYEIDYELRTNKETNYDQYLQRYKSYKDSFKKDSEFWGVMNDWSQHIEHYALYGGEPFVNKPLFDMLHSNYHNGHSKNQDLYVSTNTSVWSEKYIEILKSFKSVSIGMSIDGTGAHFEYIRHPGKWEKIKDNINKFVQLRDTRDNISLKVAATCNPFNVYYLDELCDYFSSVGVDVDIHLIQVPQYYDARILPRQVRDAIIAKHSHREDLQNVVNFLSSEMPDREKHLKDFVYMTKGTDNMRNEKFTDVFPEYSKLLQDSGINI